MNKLFLQKLEKQIKSVEKRIDKTDDWENLDEDQRKEVYADDTQLSTLKWIKELYIECIEDEETTKD